MNDVKEGSTGLPLSLVVQLNDDNPTVEVDWYFIRMVLTRLRCLESVAPRHLAEANIPDTLKYVELLKNKLL